MNSASNIIVTTSFNFSMKPSFDVLVIGSGHNGLITACMLAKQGYKVKVIERRDTIGGAVCTETMFESEKYPKGFQMDVGSSAHVMIHQTGIVEELELEKYGLEYIDMDPFMSYPIYGKEGVIHFYRDIEKTLESIRKVSPSDVDNYREFLEFWEKINKGVIRTFMMPPKTGSIVMEMMKGQFRDGAMFKKGEQLQGLQKILGSYGEVVNNQFDSEALKTAILWFAAQSGPTPDQAATGDFAGWQAMLHNSGVKHPRAGSGMLTQAMKKMLEAHGGEVIADSPVKEILVEGGKAVGVVTEDETEHRARIVVSNAHVQTTMLELLGPDHLPSSMIKAVENINVGNGFGMVIRAAVEELPNYTSAPNDPEIHNGLQLLCPDQDFMHRAIGDYQKKEPPQQPPVVAMTFSKIDEDVAPSGGHTLFAWAQWHPYELANGQKWDEIREREAQKIYDVVADYAPNIKDKRIDWYIQSPLDIERKHGLKKGNVMHVEMSFNQMFMFRPTPELGQYRTPVKNLYLSSASCHPGGGVFGAAGYNAFQTIMKDEGKKFKKLEPRV